MGLGDQDFLRWVLDNERMAYTKLGARAGAGIEPGDRLLLYASQTSLSSFGVGPRGEAGMIIARAAVLTPIVNGQALSISGRRFTAHSHLFLESLARLGAGVSLKALADELDLTRGRANYGQALRRPPVRLTASDARKLSRRLDAVAGEVEEAIADYIPQSQTVGAMDSELPPSLRTP